MIKFLVFAAIGAIAVGAVASCSTGRSLSDIAGEKAVSVSRSEPVVVFLPGTLASTLTDTRTGERVWGGENALTADPRKAAGLRRLSLPLDRMTGIASAAPDEIRADDVLRRANERVIGIPVSVSIYGDALGGLAAAGLTETAPFAIPASGPSLTAFPYDWRRSIVDAAQALGERLEGRGESARKVRIVGHSMGGVVALWYLMYGTQGLDSLGAPPPVTWAGARHVDHAILVGAPLRGAAVALRNTVNGNTLAGPLVPTLPPAMIASHPSTFELMPRGNVLQGTNAPLMDAATWQRFGWAMSDPDQRTNIEVLARGAANPIALAEQRQADLIARGKAFHAATDRRIDPPDGLKLTVISGTGSTTLAGLIVSPEGEVSEGATGDGDGTVLLSSTIAGFEDAASHPRKAVHLFDVTHARMLSQPDVFEKVLELLLE